MPDISKIKIIDNTYDVKDEEVRNVLDILSGQQEDIINENIIEDSSPES